MQTPDSSCCPPLAGMLCGRAGRGGAGRAGAGTASGGSCWYSPTRAGGGHVTRAGDTSHPHCSLCSGHTCPACRRGHLGRGHSLVLLLSGLGIDCAAALASSSLCLLPAVRSCSPPRPASPGLRTAHARGPARPAPSVLTAKFPWQLSVLGTAKLQL